MPRPTMTSIGKLPEMEIQPNMPTACHWIGNQPPEPRWFHDRPAMPQQAAGDVYLLLMLGFFGRNEAENWLGKAFLQHHPKIYKIEFALALEEKLEMTLIMFQRSKSTLCFFQTDAARKCDVSERIMSICEQKFHCDFKRTFMTSQSSLPRMIIRPTLYHSHAEKNN
jgi:hypothetical protein